MLTKRDDEILEQLEAIVSELKAGKKEASSSIAFEDKMVVGNRKKKSYLKPAAFLLFFLLIGVVGIGAYNYLAGKALQVEEGSFVEQVKELSTLATAQAYVKAVIEKEDNELFGKKIKTNIPGTKRKLLLVVPGTVTAGVDLQKVTEKQVTIDEEEKTLEVTLPQAEILHEPSLQFEKVQAFSVEGFFREEVNWEEAYELAAEAKRLIKEEAEDDGLLQMAEANAEKTLKEFFTQLGYEVTILFEK